MRPAPAGVGEPADDTTDDMTHETTEPKVAWPLVVMILFLLVVVGGLAVVWQRTEHLQSDQAAALAEQDATIDRLRAQVDAQQVIVDRTDGRLAALEAKTGSQADT
ncbi:MAG: hypothetical protein ACRDJP_06900, partial [Actinomycetota bacterium]